MIVFLDMDGVLVDFTRGVFERFGIPYELPETMRYWWFNDYGLSDEEVDSISTIDFFAGLRWTTEGKAILSAVEKIFEQSNIYLISAVMPNPQSTTGRMLWIERYLPRYKNKTWLGRIPKSLLAGPDRLLVDDKDENIAEFVAAGGQGILVPRPWNELRGWAGDTLQVVKNSLEAV
jgi:5'(3')-deoxyribonucleotidase